MAQPLAPFSVGRARSCQPRRPALSRTAMIRPPRLETPAGADAGADAGAAHRLCVRVYFEDIDAAGIVYHARTLHFMERGRTEFLRSAGIDHAAAVKAGMGAYAVTEMAIRWHRPAFLDDVLQVETRLLAARPASCRIAQVVRRGDDLVASATLVAAFLDADGRPRRQPAEWLAIFAGLAAPSPKEAA